MVNKQVHFLNSKLIVYLSLIYLLIEFQKLFLIESFIRINFILFILIFWEYIFLNEDKNVYLYIIDGLLFMLGIIGFFNIKIRIIFVSIILFMNIIFISTKKIFKIFLFSLSVLGFFNYIFFIITLICLALLKKFKFI